MPIFPRHTRADIVDHPLPGRLALGFAVAAVHGDLQQTARERALKKFRAGTITTLVATDVAARGIDIADVSHVINYECPDTDATYVHRIGRTGRAGSTGTAVTLVDWQDVTRWRVIDKTLDLGLGDPAETYSSSPHLFEDMEIPEGTKGRLPGAKPKQDRSTDDTTHGSDARGRRRRHTTDGVGDRPKTEERSKPRRPRRRRRAGVDVTSPKDAGQ